MRITAEPPEEQFVRILNAYLHPSSPIQSEEFLRGRKDQLVIIKKALASSGRNAFIYGERGVGKTSVAHTAAYLHQSSDANPILITCDKDSTCFRICQSICKKLLSQIPLEQKHSTGRKISAKTPFFNAEIHKSVENDQIPLPSSIDQAIELIAFSAERHSTSPVIVVDEFDRLPYERERGFFGDLIKQVGDQFINLKFIFCGVGSSLVDLLAGHESCFRYLSSVKLERLKFAPRMEIIEAAAKALNIRVTRDYIIRIARISDGFPHYVHLIGNKMFWAAFEDGAFEVRSDHYKRGITEAINDVEPHLKDAYDKATKKYGNEYQYVLWALADHPDFERRSTDVYDSFIRIMKQLNQQPFDRTRFNTRMNSLKKETYGSILLATRQGWYQFREPVLRGYCRLRAEDRDVQLDRDHYLEPSRLGF
ncbi:MAG: AAA family ATPase [Syntrophobacteraceae bacterium]|jgi:Cdc6-like AAA superfamily ATPase